ncbi:MAG: hypothetical protein HKN91_06595 [Acidimicrobiia bacterium]|nr:hypothetical protein [Acidimicrobiia bacterium]
MTPSQMRNQAARNRTEANVLDESARTLRSVAASIDGLLSGIAGMSRMVWQGPAATQFEEEAELHSRNVNEQADVLNGEAGGFESRARSLRSDANWLIAEAARIEAAEAANQVPGGVS